MTIDTWAAKALKDWRTNAALRAEFDGDQDRYMALVAHDKAREMGVSPRALRAQAANAVVDLDAELAVAERSRSVYGGFAPTRAWIEGLAREWSASPNLRSEFLDSFSNYRAHKQSMAGRSEHGARTGSTARSR